VRPDLFAGKCAGQADAAASGDAAQVSIALQVVLMFEGVEYRPS
jgi:hypothetical protein